MPKTISVQSYRPVGVRVNINVNGHCNHADVSAHAIPHIKKGNHGLNLTQIENLVVCNGCGCTFDSEKRVWLQTPFTLAHKRSKPIVPSHLKLKNAIQEVSR